jgi:predicted dehydrogenase
VWGILGGGFGLYGYLPALLARGEREVALPARYRSTLQSRTELAGLCERVRYFDDDEALLNAIDSLVIAQRPADTPRRVAQALERTRLRRFVLEKPLAPTPAAAADLLAGIEQHGASCQAGFTFRWTPWAAAWRRALLAAGPRAAGYMRWHFQAHHHRHPQHTTWKRQVPDGGGALRFYGIHVIALLAEWGYTAADASVVGGDLPSQASSWRARFTGPDLAPVDVEVVTDALLSRFVVGLEGEGASPVHDGGDPFDLPVEPAPVAALPATIDRRCGYVLALLDESPGERAHARLVDCTHLWAAVERKTAFVPGVWPAPSDLKASVS